MGENSICLDLGRGQLLLEYSGEIAAPQKSADSYQKSQKPLETEKNYSRQKYWAIGGGKGGVGKSLLSSNLAWLLAKKRKKKVLAVDLDFGGANLHTCLGLRQPRYSLGDWLTKKNVHLKDLLCPTEQSGLMLLSGANDPLNVLPLIHERRDEFMAELQELDFDDYIFDLGAGTHPMTLFFFNKADTGVLAILPEPTSVENAYRFLKMLYYQRIADSLDKEELRTLVLTAMQPKNDLGVRVPKDLLNIISRIDADSAKKMESTIEAFHPKLVLNQVRSAQDIEVGKAICSVCRKYFGIQAEYSGYIDYDQTVWRAVRNLKPAVSAYPNSKLSSHLQKLERTLAGEQKAIYP